MEPRTNPLNVTAYERAGWTIHAVSDELQPAMRIWVMRHDGDRLSPEPGPEPTEPEHEPEPS